MECENWELKNMQLASYGELMLPCFVFKEMPNRTVGLYCNLCSTSYFGLYLHLSAEYMYMWYAQLVAKVFDQKKSSLAVMQCPPFRVAC